MLKKSEEVELVGHKSLYNKCYKQWMQDLVG